MSRRTLTIAAAGVGLLLFIYAIRRAGVAEIVDGVRRVGWGLLVILAVGGLRFALRAQAWRLCIPSGSRLDFRHAFMAFIAGDAVGTVTPLGLLASEPTKVLLTRHHLATRESVASLALENIVYAVSVLGMVVLGILVLLTTVPLPVVLREGLWVAVALAIVGIGVVAWVTRHGIGAALPRSSWRERLSTVRLELRGVTPGTLAAIFSLDALYHAVAVFEVFFTLTLLLGEQRPTLGQSIVFEALNRVATVAFKFVPFRVGIDEALNGALAPLLTLPGAAGVTLAVVRKIRNLFWAGVGLAFVATHPDGTSRR